MFFYEVYVQTSTDMQYGSKTENLPEGDWFDLENGEDIYRRFFKETSGKAFMFPRPKKGRLNNVDMYLAAEDETSPENYAGQLAKRMGLKDIRIIGSTEITMREFMAFLRTARHKDVISEDEEDFFRLFHMEGMDSIFHIGSYSDSYRWEEEMVFEPDDGEDCDPAPQLGLTEDILLAKTSGLFCPEDMQEEIRRIYKPKCMKGEGIPVHYILEYGDSSSVREAQKILTQALYLNGRLKSARVLSIHIEDGSFLSSVEMEEIYGLYKMGSGGTISIDFHKGVEYESIYARPGRGTIENLCRIIRSFRHEVLTILHISDKEVKKVFLEYLDRMTMVEIREKPADLKRANRYLKELAAGRAIRTDKELLVDSGEGFTKSWLDEHFTDWYEDKIKNKVYPQYREHEMIRLDRGMDVDHGDGISELKQMTGLAEAKKAIEGILDHQRMAKILKHFDMPEQDLSLHMVFKGNPGTAKTTVARLYARILRENGVLSKGDLIEVGRQDLVGKYVGWTAKIVKSIFERAKGSVLFIDEAYALLDSENGGYGDEAINAIVQEMENKREDMAVIFAGYSAPMEEFLRRNPGLRSRINYQIDFPDYGEEELMAILDQMAAAKKMHLTEEAREKARGQIRMALTNEDFGNGRFVRNLFEQALVCHGSRLIHSSSEELDREHVSEMTGEDFENLQTGIRENVKTAIGFG